MVKFHTTSGIVVLAILVSPALALGVEKLTDIPTKHQVILKDEWKPTKEQTTRALKHIQIYLEHPRKGYRSDPKSMDDIREILSHASTYYVQFIGRYPKGRKAIWCNFFTMSIPEIHSGWREREVWFSDCGSDYWQIWFEPDKDEASGFGANPCCPSIR
jgi:hypothetical protein